jgi:hypothetical protein
MYPCPSALIELPASTCTDPAWRLTPAPCQVPLTCAVVFVACKTIEEFPLTVIPFATVTDEPPPMVNAAPLCTVRLVTL